MFLEIWIFEILYFLKMCPIFVGYAHDFGKGQIISKANYLAVNSSKNPMNEFISANMQCVLLFIFWKKLKTQKTSLKIFKHYKLKPSFSIIKDEKTKDKVGVGDKPPPPSFNELIKFDPILSSFSNLIQFNPIWSNLIQFIPIWSNLIQFDQVWSNLFYFIPIWSSLNRFDPIWTNLSCFNQSK